MQEIFQQLGTLRTPSGIPGPNDSPFLGLATGLYPTAGETQFPGFGINNTLLRSAIADGAGNTPRLFEAPVGGPPGTPPYVRYQLLSKIFNNVTTRSNVFAIWTTVGFFEVLDDSTNPPKLGAEIGSTDNTNIRHRFFMIVDRSNYVVPASQATLANQPALPNILTYGIPVTVGTTLIPISAGTTPTVAFNGQLSGTTSVPSPTPARGWSWNIQAGTALLVDPGPNQEMVVVQAAAPGSSPVFVGSFARSHAATCPMILFLYPGFPGPQPNFDVKQNSALVLYYNIIN